MTSKKPAEKKKAYTAEDLRAARIRGIIQGRAEAEEYLQGRMNKICASNHQLLVEIMRLDLNEPVVAVSVPRKFAEGLVYKLRKRDKRDWQAKMLKFYMNKSDAEMFEKPDEIMKELVTVDDCHASGAL